MSDKTTPLLVFSRFRPFVKSEVTATSPAKCCAAFHKSGQKLLLKYGPDKPKEYVSETVFNMNSTQEQLYDVVGSDLTKKTLEGYNGTIVLLGARNTGKTFTIVGSFTPNVPNAFVEEKPSDGLLPRFIRESFDKILQAEESLEFTICLSVYEVMNGTGVIIDLLNETMASQKRDEQEGLECVLQEDTGEIEVAGLIEEYVASDEELFQLLTRALRYRTDQSTLFIEVTISQKHLRNKTVKTSRVSFIDLEASQVQQDPNTDPEMESENGQDIFTEIAKAIAANDKGHNFYESSLKALLYSRAFRNSETRLVVTCSPAIGQVKPFTEPNLDFATLVKPINVPCKVNLHALVGTAAVVEATPTSNQLETALEQTSELLSNTVINDQLKKLQEKEQLFEQQTKEVQTLKGDLHRRESEIEQLKQKSVELEKSIKAENDKLTKSRQKNKLIVDKLTVLQRTAKELQSNFDKSSPSNLSEQVKQFTHTQSDKLKVLSDQFTERIVKYEQSLQSEVTRKISDLNGKAESLQKENEQLTKKMDSEIEKRKQLEKEVSDRMTQITELKEQLIEKSTELEIARDQQQSSKEDNEQVDALNKKISNLQNQLSQLTDKLQDRENSLKQTNDQLSKLIDIQGEADRLKDKVSKITSDNASQVDKLNQRLKERETTHNTLVGELNTSKLKIQESELKFEELNAKLKDSQHSLNNKDAKINNLQSELQTKSQERIQVEQQLQKEKEKNEQLSGEIQKLTGKVNEVNSENASKKKELDQLRDQIDSINSELKEAVHERDSLTKKLSENEERLKDKQEQEQKVKNLQGQVTTLEGQIKLKEDSIQSLKKQLENASVADALKQQLQQQVAQIEKLESENLTLKYEISEKSGELTSLKEELEKQATEKNEEISRLKSELDFSTHDASKLRKDVRDMTEKANGLEVIRVQLNSELKSLTEKLEERNNAIIARDTLNKKQTEEKSVIEKELKELKETLQAKNSGAESQASQLDSIRKQLLEKNEKIAKLESDLNRTNSSSSQFESEKNDLENKVKELNNVIQNLQSQTSSSSAEIKNFQKQIEDLNKRIASQEEQIKNQNDDKSELESTVQTLKSEQKSLNSKIDELNKQLNEQQQTFLSKSIGGSADSNQMQQLQEQLTEKFNTITVQQKEIKALKETLNNQTKKIAEMRKQASKSEIQTMKQKDQLEAIQKEKDALQKDLAVKVEEAKQEALSEFKSEKQKWDLETAEAKNLAQTYQDDVQVKTHQIENLNQLITHYRSRIDELEDKLDKSNEESQQEVQKVQDKYNELQAQLEELQREQEEQKNQQQSSAVAAVQEEETKFNDDKMEELMDLRERVKQLESQNSSLREEVRTRDLQMKEMRSHDNIKRQSIRPQPIDNRRQSIVIPKNMKLKDLESLNNSSNTSSGTGTTTTTGTPLSDLPVATTVTQQASSTATSTSNASASSFVDRKAYNKSGFLKKEGERVKSWKRRWFSVNSADEKTFRFAYYKNANDTKPIKEITLTRDCLISEAPEKENSSRQFCFKIVSKSRVLYLHCATEQERREWMSALKTVVSLCA